MFFYLPCNICDPIRISHFYIYRLFFSFWESLKLYLYLCFFVCFSSNWKLFVMFGILVSRRFVVVVKGFSKTLKNWLLSIHQIFWDAYRFFAESRDLKRLFFFNDSRSRFIAILHSWADIELRYWEILSHSNACLGIALLYSFEWTMNYLTDIG